MAMVRRPSIGRPGGPVIKEGRLVLLSGGAWWWVLAEFSHSG